MEIYEMLCQAAGQSRVLCNEPMNRHTTFRAGGAADYFVQPIDKETLKNTITILKENRIPYYIIGNGSNLLVGDKGYHGVIISMYSHFDRVEFQDTLVLAEAGVSMGKLARLCMQQELAGFEFAAGIPGTIGGAVTMNAGAYGSEMNDIIRVAEVMTCDGEIKKIPAKDLQLGYRTSCVKEREWIILSVSLQLKKGSASDIQAYINELAMRRKEKQPLEYASAGSTFKRPKGHFAGKLIMDAGLKGYRVGGACVSQKHCGFVINDGQATAKDILTLCEHIKKTVLEKSGIPLEMEVKILGDF